MSGCDAPITYVTDLTGEWRLKCDCDHGEDDPCCSETEDPQEEKETT